MKVSFLNLVTVKYFIEAVATGTFIYVTFLELVPHEFMGDVEKGPLKSGVITHSKKLMIIHKIIKLFKS